MRTIVVLCLLLCFAAAGCGKKESSAPAKPIVLVSVPSYLYFVQRIAGDTVTAVSLTPPGANPHIYEPTPKEVQQFRHASLWIRLGEPSEKKTYTVLKEQSHGMRIVDITEGISLLPVCEGQHSIGKGHSHCHHEEGMDLHIWLSPKLAEKQAETIAKQLSELLPNNKDAYERALALFLSDLKTLSEEIRSLLTAKNGSAVLVSHPAFAYFCQDYHLTQFSIETEGKEPLPQDITYILNMAKKHKIANVIIEPQYSDKGAQLIAESLEVPVYIIDPYSQEYMKNLRFIAEVMAKT